MFEQLDSIRWRELEHAYGTAEDVPSKLRALLSDEDKVRSEALYQLCGRVCHQGTIYSSSAYVIPFLRELIAAPQVKDKDHIVMLLASIAGGRGYYQVHEAIVRRLSKQPLDLSKKFPDEERAVQAVRKAVTDHLPELLEYLSHPVSAVRIAVADALPCYPEHYLASTEAVEQAKASETDSEVIEAFDEALEAMQKNA